MTDEEIKDMIESLKANEVLIDMALEDKAEGNYYGAGQLIHQYDAMVEDELEYWGVTYEWAVNNGLVVDTVGLV